MARERSFSGTHRLPKLATALALLVFVWALAFSFAAAADCAADSRGPWSDDESAFDDVMHNAIAVAPVELGPTPVQSHRLCSATPPAPGRCHAASLDPFRAPPLN